MAIINLLQNPTIQIVVVLGLLVLSVVLFSIERVSVDITTLLLLTALVATGILTPAEAFAGFSNDIIVILASIFVISGALQRTGAMDSIGARLHRIAGYSERRILLAVMALVSSGSAFMNNTTVTAVFVAPTLELARRARLSASKLLMPVAFASILGGTCTLIGTSTNVAVSGYIERMGMKPLTLFEITPIGLIITFVGIAYVLFLGRRLLPVHRDESLTDEFAIREYLSEIVVLPNSHLIGQKVFQSELSKLDLRILEVIRANEKFLPNAQTGIHSGDTLLVEGRIDDLLRVKETAGIEIRADSKLGDRDLESEGFRVAEALITAQSSLVNRTLKEANFRVRYGMTALAIYRQGQSLREKVGRIPLRMGDLLLLQGPAERLDELRRHQDLWVLEELSPALYRRKKGLYAAGIFAGAVIVGALGWAPLSIAFLLAAVLTVLVRSISIDEAYRSIDWRLLILIGGMTAFGAAMAKTGAAAFLANAIVSLLAPLGVTVVLAGFLLLTVALTQPMSNAAAALVVLPVAIEAAQKLGVNPRTFAIAIMLAASVSFITPFEPSCILVYGPGKYRFWDFVKTGSFLTIIVILFILAGVPLFWPLHP